MFLLEIIRMSINWITKLFVIIIIGRKVMRGAFRGCKMWEKIWVVNKLFYWEEKCLNMRWT